MEVDTVAGFFDSNGETWHLKGCEIRLWYAQQISTELMFCSVNICEYIEYYCSAISQKRPMFLTSRRANLGSTDISHDETGPDVHRCPLICAAYEAVPCVVKMLVRVCSFYSLNLPLACSKLVPWGQHMHRLISINQIAPITCSCKNVVLHGASKKNTRTTAEKSPTTYPKRTHCHFWLVPPCYFHMTATKRYCWVCYPNICEWNQWIWMMEKQALIKN